MPTIFVNRSKIKSDKMGLKRDRDMIKTVKKNNNLKKYARRVTEPPALVIFFF